MNEITNKITVYILGGFAGVVVMLATASPVILAAPLLLVGITSLGLAHSLVRHHLEFKDET